MCFTIASRRTNRGAGITDRSFVKRDRELAVVDWNYNAWGGKYPPFDEDDAVPQRVAELLGLPVFSPGIVMEGGALDVNGEGTLLTTEACLLNPNRNPQLNKQQIEQHLKDYLGVTTVLWLGSGIVGDDTDGHVDDLARFVNPTTVVTVVEQDPQDDNYRPLQENLKRLRTMRDQDGRALRIVELPMPGMVEHEGQRLPASYANFYIANERRPAADVPRPEKRCRGDKDTTGTFDRTARDRNRQLESGLGTRLVPLPNAATTRSRSNESSDSYSGC